MFAFFESIGNKLMAVVLLLGISVAIVGGTGWLGLGNTGNVVDRMASQSTRLSGAVDQQSALLQQSVDAAGNMGRMAGEISERFREIETLFRDFSERLSVERQRVLDTNGQALLALLAERETGARSLLGGIVETKEIKALAAGFPDADARDRVTRWMENRMYASDVDFYVAMPGAEGENTTVIASDLKFNATDLGHVNSVHIARRDEEVDSGLAIVKGELVVQATGLLTSASYDPLSVLMAGYTLSPFRIKELAQAVGAEITLFVPETSEKPAVTSFDIDTTPAIADVLIPEGVLDSFTTKAKELYDDGAKRADIQQALRERTFRRLNDRGYDILYQGLTDNKANIIAIAMLAVDVTEVVAEIENVNTTVSDVALDAGLIDDERKDMQEISESSKTAAQDVLTQVEQIRVELDAMASEAAVTVEGSRTVLVVVTLIVLGIVIFALLMVQNIIVKPIRAVTGVMTRLADNDLDVEIPNLEAKGEIGAMSRTVEIFKGNAQERIKLEAEQRASEQRAEEETTRQRHQMADNFETSVGQIVNALSGSSGAMHKRAEILENLSRRSNELSSGAADASTRSSVNVQAVAAAAEELNLSIVEISRQASQSNEISNTAMQTVDKTRQQAGKLSEAVDNIDQVVELITSIAAQTNMLALNATIEAERAGEAGLGFGVVANEVKALAQQTADATEEIVRYVGDITDVSKDTIDANDQVSDIMRKIAETSSSIASAVEQQRASTQEISRNVQEVAAGTDEVRDNITGVTNTAGEVGNTAAEVLDSAKSLSTQTGDLETSVQEFLTSIRQ